MDALYFLLGLVALVVGAELLVRGSSRLALACGISPLVVGLTIVAFGTSAPEVAVSVGAALRGSTEVAFGNVVGSNIFNVLFILGASALIVPLTVDRQIIRQEVPVMIGASALTLWLVHDGTIAMTDAVILLALLVVYTVFLVVQSRAANGRDPVPAPEVAAAPRAWDDRLPLQIVEILAGLGLLVLGADWLVDSATSFARALGISDTVIGLTIVAAGTSLPEVATSLTAAVRGQRDIAIGNVVGSNTFNLLGCLGATGVVAANGVPVPPTVLDFDLPVMVAVAALCLPVFFTGREIARWEGLLFLVGYACYTAWTVLAATQHAALASFRTAMNYVVLPVAGVALALSLIPRRKPR